MRILLTGGTGFTGKKLLPLLEKSGHEVVHLVRGERGFNQEFVWNFYNELPEDLPPCDVIIHLAACVCFGQELRLTLYNANTVSTIKLADYARRHSAYFILASTTGVHGSDTDVIDGKAPINPQSHYGMSKYLAEEAVKTMANKYSILRISGIYGLDGPGHLGLNSAISKAYHKKGNPVLKGSGKAKRNYICVQDAARWIRFLVDGYEKVDTRRRKNPSEILYLAGPEIMTIEDYLKQIIEILLPGQKVDTIEGPEGRDMVVRPEPFPFVPLKFGNYLTDLRQKM